MSSLEASHPEHPLIHPARHDHGWPKGASWVEGASINRDSDQMCNKDNLGEAHSGISQYISSLGTAALLSRMILCHIFWKCFRSWFQMVTLSYNSNIRMLHSPHGEELYYGQGDLTMPIPRGARICSGNEHSSFVHYSWNPTITSWLDRCANSLLVCDGWICSHQ